MPGLTSRRGRNPGGGDVRRPRSPKVQEMIEVAGRVFWICWWVRVVSVVILRRSASAWSRWALASAIRLPIFSPDSPNGFE